MARLNSDKVLTYLGKRVRTTNDIAEHFKVKKGQAAAAIAILRIKGVVEPAIPTKDDDGYSRWRRSA